LGWVTLDLIYRSFFYAWLNCKAAVALFAAQHQILVQRSISGAQEF
jgi:hypothetical protein